MPTISPMAWPQKPAHETTTSAGKCPSVVRTPVTRPPECSIPMTRTPPRNCAPRASARRRRATTARAAFASPSVGVWKPPRIRFAVASATLRKRRLPPARLRCRCPIVQTRRLSAPAASACFQAGATFRSVRFSHRECARGLGGERFHIDRRRDSIAQRLTWARQRDVSGMSVGCALLLARDISLPTG